MKARQGRTSVLVQCLLVGQTWNQLLFHSHFVAEELSRCGEVCNGKDSGGRHIRVPTLPWLFVGSVTLKYPITTSLLPQFPFLKKEDNAYSLNHTHLVE